MDAAEKEQVSSSESGSSTSVCQPMQEDEAVFHTPPQHHSRSDTTTNVRVLEDVESETKRLNVVPAEVIVLGCGDSNGEETAQVSLVEAGDGVNRNHELGIPIEGTDSSQNFDSAKIERGFDGDVVSNMVGSLGDEGVAIEVTDSSKIEREYDGQTVSDMVGTEGDEGVAVNGSGDPNGEEMAEGSLGEAKDGVAISELGGKVEYSKGIVVTDSSPDLDSGKIEREYAGDTVSDMVGTEGDEGVEVIALGSGDPNGVETGEGSLGEAKDGAAINEFEYSKGIEVTDSSKIEREYGGETVSDMVGTEGDEGVEVTVLGSGVPNGKETAEGSSGEVKDGVPKSDSSGESKRDTAKRIEDIDKFRYTADGECKGKDNKKSSKKGLMDFLDELTAIFGETPSDDEDIIEIAKKKGMVFPKPRWYKDHS